MGQANLTHTEAHRFSMVDIKPIVPINQHEINRLAHYSTIVTPPQQPYSLLDQTHIQYIETKPKMERSTLTIPVEDRRADIEEEEVSMFVIFDDSNTKKPSINKLHETLFDDRDSLNTSQTNEQHIKFNSSTIQQLESFNESISVSIQKKTSIYSTLYISQLIFLLMHHIYILLACFAT